MIFGRRMMLMFNISNVSGPRLSSLPAGHIYRFLFEKKAHKIPEY